MDGYLVNTHYLTCHTNVLHNKLLPPLPYLIHSTTDGALIRCALVSASVAFLLLTPLIAGIILRLVLLRRVKRIVLEKEGKFEKIKFIETKENIWKTQRVKVGNLQPLATGSRG